MGTVGVPLSAVYDGWFLHPIRRFRRRRSGGRGGHLHRVPERYSARGNQDADPPHRCEGYAT